MTGLLTGVGVGPGDPDLLTVRGRDVLNAADVLFVPVASRDELGHAERVVLAHVPAGTPVQRLVFSVAAGTAPRDATWETAADAVAAVVADGRSAAFATIGDPNVYSTFTHLAPRVRSRVPDVEVRTVPGITAMQDLASRSGTPLLVRDERLALVPVTAGDEHVASALADADTVVLYKAGRHLPRVRSLLEQAGRADHAVVGTRLGIEGETVGTDVPDDPRHYLSTVVVTRPRP